MGITSRLETLRPASNKDKDISRMQAAGTACPSVSFEGHSWDEVAEALFLLRLTPKFPKETIQLV